MTHKLKARVEKAPFLMQADAAAAEALDLRIAEAFPDPKARKRMRDYLNNVVLRPLLELTLNGATSLTGARILKSWNFVEVDRYQVHFGECKGLLMEAVRISDEGAYELDQLSPVNLEDRVFNKLVNAVASYVAIDPGCGIVARRELIDFAFDYSDSEILSHLVEMQSGRYQIAKVPFSTIVSEEERLEVAIEYWCGSIEPRSGAAFIDLTK